MKMKNAPMNNYLKTSGAATTRIGLTKEEIKASFLENLYFGIGRLPSIATRNDLYTALALTVRDRVLRQSVRATAEFAEQDSRAIAYLSAEYLPGPHLDNNLLNLNITDLTREALAELDLDLDEILGQEEEPGLGNGGLGRLASCYMDSMATLGIPAIGYGIRYEFGIFRQTIKDGWQHEETDKWLQHGNPWEIARPEIAYEVKFGGWTESTRDKAGKLHFTWHPNSVVKGTAYDTPILGYNSNAISMRLWKAEAIESFDFDAFNKGDYYKAVEAKMVSENIAKVLYPNDETLSGKELRLKQQYFFVSCSLQDLIHQHLFQGREMNEFHSKYTIQLNDTHPSIAVAELMRLLLDEHQLEWEEAWKITRRTFAYTNHTLLPEALEKWSVSLLRNLLPRLLEIIFEINSRFIAELRSGYNYSEERIRNMSIIQEEGEQSVRMAFLATVGSYKVNGVSALHSKLLVKNVLNDFAELWPDKFTNVTNGISPRRFFAVSNPLLVHHISEHIGYEWHDDLNKLESLENFADDAAFQHEWMDIKLQNKEILVKLIDERCGVKVHPAMLFDIQVKRIHEYKRQHLKVLQILSLYLKLKKGEGKDIPPTAFIFAGKAAPGYVMAKLIIKFITAVGDLINNDPEAEDILKVAFIPNFNVKQAQKIYPAADLSEQISLAGKEASGTGNMKFALNGALTVGTLDGANVEIRDEVGEENFFLFGLNTEEVQAAREAGYHPFEVYKNNAELREVMDFMISGKLSNGDKELFRPLYDNLLGRDPYLLLEDYQSYVDQMEKVYEVWSQPKEWARKSILNVSRIGKFSSDRSIEDYCKNIWKLEAVKVM